MKHWRTKKLKELMQTIVNFTNKEEAFRFFRDLCTLDELEEMAERWHIAQLLDQGKSIREVAKASKVSTTTVVRISQWLRDGEGGYKAALAKLPQKK